MFNSEAGVFAHNKGFNGFAIFFIGNADDGRLQNA